jgi:hypothetical protein
VTIPAISGKRIRGRHDGVFGLRVELLLLDEAKVLATTDEILLGSLRRSIVQPIIVGGGGNKATAKCLSDALFRARDAI